MKFKVYLCWRSYLNYVAVRWHCWLGSRKDIRPVETKWWGAGVFICLERGAVLHMAQLMPLSLASVKSRLVLPFWYRPTHVVPEKGLLNVCVLGCFKNSIKICSYCRPHRVHNIDKACCYRFNQHGCLYISWSVRELSVIGGSTLEDATRRIMRTLFTTNLALQYNWTSHDSKKSAVWDLQLTAVTCSEWNVHCQLIHSQ